ncbi:hypothetical protein, partial [Faecalicoccus acidiformans]|uniref:hypothetical protein n=1 Tax=Faecalicoccus acidiformans TaxID=915173 RepID=UPI00320A586A
GLETTSRNISPLDCPLNSGRKPLNYLVTRHLTTALPSFYFFSFEYSSLIDFPCKNILYELLTIRSGIASATDPLPNL